MKTRLLIIFSIFILTPLISFYDVHGLTINKPELNRSNCELFASEIPYVDNPKQSDYVGKKVIVTRDFGT